MFQPALKGAHLCSDVVIDGICPHTGSRCCSHFLDCDVGWVHMGEQLADPVHKKMMRKRTRLDEQSALRVQRFA